MIRIEHQSPSRLVLSDAQHSGIVWAIAGFFLLATVILWGAAPTLGPFGIGFALIWTVLFVFMFSQVDWVRAEFDADSNTLKTSHGRLYRAARHVRHDLGDLGAVTWDDISVWAALIGPKDDIARARSALVIRRADPSRKLTEQELAALGEPLRLDGLPEKLPKVRIGDVIRDWRAQARDA